MSETRVIWEQLEADAVGQATGVARRRIHADSLHDLWLAIDLTSWQRQLIHNRHDVQGPTPELPQSRAVAANNRTLPNGHIETTVSLLDPDFADVFTTLVGDIASATALTPDDPSAATALAARLWHWKRLLEGLSDDGLSKESRRGLFGELWVIRHLVDQGVPVFNLIDGWTGPAKKDQDLQVGEYAVEIKTTTGRQPEALQIASERQLDDTGLSALHLVHLSLDERRGGTGTSLNALVDGVADQARAHPPADTILTERLHLAGYLTVHRPLYDEPRYTPRSLNSYWVRVGFPRIVEPLTIGTGNVRYDIAISSCEPFKVPNSELIDQLTRAMNSG